MSKTNLGILNYNLGNIKIAVSQVEKSIELLRISLGDNHPYIQKVKERYPEILNQNLK